MHLQGPSACFWDPWEVGKKCHYLTPGSKQARCSNVSLLSPTSRTSASNVTQEVQPDVGTLSKGRTAVGNSWATTPCGKTEHQNIITILWLISGGGKKGALINMCVFIYIFLYVEIYIFAYWNIHFWGKENPRVLLRSHFTYYRREDILGKELLPDKMLKVRLCECMPSFCSAALREHWWVSAEGWKLSFPVKYFHIYPAYLPRML